MAITIASEILGQDVSATVSYCYLYEPLRINVYEDNFLAVKFYVDVELISIVDGSTIETLVRYAEFDINPGKSLTFDAMEIAQQIHNSNVYKIANMEDFAVYGKYAVVSQYIYKYTIYSDKTETPVIVRKLPLIGGREFREFTASVNNSSPITEFQKYGINEELLAERWGGFSFVKTQLASITSSNLTPIVTRIGYPLRDYFGGGAIIWKSRLGGWMFWGFELVKRTDSHSYDGSLSSPYFESTAVIGGNPYIPVNYTSVSTSFSLDLKSLSLTMNELKAVSGILSTTAVYYIDHTNDRVELMKLTSATVPIDNLANGGDFSVSLTNISKLTQKTM